MKPAMKNSIFAVYLALALSLTMLPFLMMMLETLATADLDQPMWQRYHPLSWSLDSFIHLFELSNFNRFIFNSSVHALGYTLLSLFLNSLAAYAFARVVFPGRDRLFSLLILTMMIPGQVVMIPVFMVVKSLGMLNSFMGLILPGCAHAFGILAMRQFMLDLPDEIFEAAVLDGASDFDIFRKIVWPLCRPIYASLAVTSFIYTWDQFLYPLVIMQDENMFTLPVALVSLTSKAYGHWGVLLAGGIVTALPSLVVFLIAQRAYVAGITGGSVKN